MAGYESNEASPFIFSSDFNIPSKNLDLAKLREIYPQLREKNVLPESLIAPWFVMWDITYKCNLRCKYCYNCSSQPLDNELSREELLNIAGQISELNVFSVCLTGGEPTQRDCYIDVAKELRKNGIIPNTITNGRNVSDDLIKEMAKVFGVIQTSIDGSSQATHDYLRGKGSFEKVIETAKLLIRYGAELQASFVCTKYNIDDFENTIYLAKSLGVKRIRTMPLLHTGKVARNSDLAPTDEQYKALAKKLSQFKDPDIEVEWGDPLLHMKVGDIFGFNQGIEIMANGDIALSPYLPFIFGNLRAKRLTQIWNDIRLGWRHPVVRNAVNGINSVDDLAKVNGLVPWVDKHVVVDYVH